MYCYCDGPGKKSWGHTAKLIENINYAGQRTSQSHLRREDWIFYEFSYLCEYVCLSVCQMSNPPFWEMVSLPPMALYTT